MPFKTYPIVLVSIAYTLGCAAGIMLRSAPLVTAAVTLTASVFVLLTYPTGKKRWGTLLIALFLLGASMAVIKQTPQRSDISRFAGRSRQVVVEGYISSEPEGALGRQRFLIKADKIFHDGTEKSVAGMVCVRTGRWAGISGEGLSYGQKVAVKGALSIPEGPKESGGFSFRDYLARQGVFSVIVVDKPSSLVFLEGQSGAFPLRWASSVRKGLQQVLHDRLPEGEAGLVSGMLLGSYDLVPEDLLEDFRRTGTLHLLAASGFNCALIVLIFWHLMLRPLGMHRRASLLFVTGLIIFYVLIVGGKPSIVRAGVGATLYLTALYLGRPSSHYSVLFATAFLILLVNPLALADVGFQLSFAAVGSIIAFAPLVLRNNKEDQDDNNKKETKRLLWKLPLVHLLQVAVVTSAATVATAPIIAQYFNRVSLVSLPANMAVAFLAEMLFVASTALSFLFWVPGLDWLLTKIVYGLALAVEWVVMGMSSVQLAEVSSPSPGFVGILVLYGFIAAGWWGAKGRMEGKNSVRNTQMKENASV